MPENSTGNPVLFFVERRRTMQRMQKKHSRFHVGLRTIKTATAVVTAMIVVELYGATASKLIFAMLGAMAAVQPTFKESWESCVTQTVGVIFGAGVGVILLALPIHPLVAVGIGMIMVITLYNALRIRYSPSLPCFILVTLCTTPDVQPVIYAAGRIWDTAIGLGVGMAINSLIFPYDNRTQIRFTMESLDRELIAFLEEMFDGDNVLPDPEGAARKIEDMDKQLKIFAGQKLYMRPSHQRRELAAFRDYEEKARQLISHMNVLRDMEHPGRLNEESRRKLKECGADIRDRHILVEQTDRDVVTNYHVEQILKLRRELLEDMGAEI